MVPSQAGCQIPLRERAESSVAEAPRGSELADDESSLDDDSLRDQDLVQQFTRRREADGGEWVTGVLRVAFEPGQRTAHAHVAFCPPFATIPSCEAEPVSGPDAELKIAQVLPQGTRFDVRLAECAQEPVSLLVEFAAHWQAAAE